MEKIKITFEDFVLTIDHHKVDYKSLEGWWLLVIFLLAGMLEADVVTWVGYLGVFFLVTIWAYIKTPQYNEDTDEE